MTKENIIRREIKRAIDKHAFINFGNMTVNELLFAISHYDGLKDPFVNLKNATTGEFSFGFANGFWPVRHRALKVIQYDVWIDNDSGNYAIEITAEEADA